MGQTDIRYYISRLCARGLDESASPAAEGRRPPIPQETPQKNFFRRPAAGDLAKPGRNTLYDFPASVLQDYSGPFSEND